MDWVKTFFETLAGYAVRWRTRGGFLRVGALLLAAAWELKKTAEMPVPFLYIGPAVVILWSAVWVVGSGRIPIPPHQKTVVFAIDVDVEAERNFRRIFQRLRAALAALPISRPIRLKRIAPDLVQTDKGATKYLDNYGVAQVIWGHALAGKAQSQSIQQFQIRWTQRIPANVDINAVLSDLALLEHGRKWTIADVNDLIDVNVVTEDFLEMSLAVIGILFMLETNLSDAAILFGRVVAGLRQHSNASAIESKIDRFQEILHQTQIGMAFKAHDDGEHHKAVAILEQIAPIYPKDIDCRLTLARAHFLAGNTAAAITCTDQIAQIDPTHPAIYANRAFFCILQRNYADAAKWYDELVRSSRDKLAVLTSVSEFLEERYEESPDEHAYLFGQAVVNGEIDPSLMRADLQKFIGATANTPQYEPLRAQAKALLSRRR